LTKIKGALHINYKFQHDHENSSKVLPPDKGIGDFIGLQEIDAFRYNSKARQKAGLCYRSFTS